MVKEQHTKKKNEVMTQAVTPTQKTTT